MVDKGIPIRLVLYSVAILYLAIDFFVIGGPLRRAVFRQNPKSEDVIEAAKAEGVVARVYFQPILLSQVDRRVEENLWRQGRRREEVRAAERIELRRAALDDLIDLHLLRLKVRFNQSEVPVSKEEIDAEVARFEKRFASRTELTAVLDARGWSAKELRYRLAARIQQEKYLEVMIEVTVSEEEARDWYEENRSELALPDRVRARHIFLRTSGRDVEEGRTRLEAARQQIESGQAEFAGLARELSEDLRSREKGGELGWLQAGRLPEDLADSLSALGVGERAVVRSKLGWHLLEVLEKQARRERTYDEARADVVAALEAVKRDEGLKLYRRNLRERDKYKVEVFLDVLEREVAPDYQPE